MSSPLYSPLYVYREDRTSKRSLPWPVSTCQLGTMYKPRRYSRPVELEMCPPHKQHTCLRWFSPPKSSIFQTDKMSNRQIQLRFCTCPNCIHCKTHLLQSILHCTNSSMSLQCSMLHKCNLGTAPDRKPL